MSTFGQIRDFGKRHDRCGELIHDIWLFGQTFPI